MAIKKSGLYSSLWASCDELRGGMDASQNKDYVLFMLFIKYVSDKYGDSDDFAPPVVIPKGASFKDMVALKGNGDIGKPIPSYQVYKGTVFSGLTQFESPNNLMRIGQLKAEPRPKGMPVAERCQRADCARAWPLMHRRGAGKGPVQIPGRR